MYSLERLEKIIKQAPETKHEENFQQCYRSTIQKAIEKFKMPLDPLDAQKNWEQLKQVSLEFLLDLICFEVIVFLQMFSYLYFFELIIEGVSKHISKNLD